MEYELGKKLDELQKEIQETKNAVYYIIRMLDTDLTSQETKETPVPEQGTYTPKAPAQTIREPNTRLK